MEKEQYDFGGYATRNDLICSDGRVIRKDAFKHCDGQIVPMIWNHDHNNPDAVLGHALLENREDGVYAYGKFNEETEQGKNAKSLVHHGDVRSLSIYANKLKQIGSDVIHGDIRELSLVLAGANPGATIDFVLAHGESDDDSNEALYACYDENALVIYHSEESKKEEKETKQVAEETKKTEEQSEKTVEEVFNTLTEEQKTVVYALIGQALKDAEEESKEDKSEGEEKSEDNVKHSEGGDNEMKSNVFDKETQRSNVLTHADQATILDMAKRSNVGSLKAAMEMFAEQNGTEMKHGFVNEEGAEAVETLFPEYKLVTPGAPELIERDLSWVDHVLNTIHKSPISRIRTRNADARVAELRAKGYKKGEEKTISGNIKLITRTTDPQTVYRKDELNRDDIVDITDFDVVAYQWNVMRNNLNEELALAALVGDGRLDGDADKIHEDHIRSIWNDEDIYTIHASVDVEAAKKELQGTDTGANFGENYIYAEAIITAALYAREQYKGSGSLDFFCTPHMLNVMLLARDLNGRRIYSSKSDLAAALNVKAIYTVEQFEGLTRTDKNGAKQKLLGLFVNLADYQFGCTKGGEITKFDDFDIDFNKYKYLMETRLSGALTKLYSAIALEEPVAGE